jgi:hypothetical protein
MSLAFWEDGHIALPFLEPCPSTWKGEIFHSSWNLEISNFQKIAKIRVRHDLHVKYWNYCLMKK